MCEKYDAILFDLADAVDMLLTAESKIFKRKAEKDIAYLLAELKKMQEESK